MPLAPEVRLAAARALQAIRPVWMSLDRSDYRRIYRPQGNGSYSIEIQSYLGSSTLLGFFKHLDDVPEVSQLAKAIADRQPELLGYVALPGQGMALGDCKRLVAVWCRALEPIEPDDSAAIAQIDRLLEELSALLDRRSLTHRITTSITGLRLPTPDFSLPLDAGVTLRGMTADEIAELSSQDVTFGREHDIVGSAVSSCLVFEGSAPFALERTHHQALQPSIFEEEARNHTADVLRALHVLRPGRAGVFMTTSTYSPQLLPLGQGSSRPLQHHPFASFDLLDDDIDTFMRLLGSIRAGVRDVVRIAADRLLDAENRLSPVDALLDAAIGLEALLNPNDNSELAFRVALNFAHLATAEHRRERYERVRTIQKTRNRVVHGGLNLHSPNAPIIGEHADLAKACLRDAVKCFLLDPGLAGNRTLDAEFWLDRILPVNIGAVQPLPPAE